MSLKEVKLIDISTIKFMKLKILKFSNKNFKSWKIMSRMKTIT